MKGLNKRELLITLKRTEQAQALIQFLQRRGVRLRTLQLTEKHIAFRITENHLSLFRQGRKKYRVKTRIRYMAPDKILQHNATTVIGFVLLLCVPLFFMQFIWKMTVVSEVVEVEDELQRFLQHDLQLQLPLHKNDLPSDTQLRQQIMEHFRQFSWVHIAKEGSRLTITPEFAPKAENEKQQRRSLYLVAASSGVITHFNIESGERKIKPNMTVYKGDVLVSGVVGDGEQQSIVGAKGEVYADYFLETTFTVPRTLQYDRVAEQLWQWEWNKDALWQVVGQKSLVPLKNLIVYEKRYRIERVIEKLEPPHVETRLLPLLHEKILYSLPQKSSIKSENILHVSFDDDTVKGKILFFVNENIAMPSDGQGD